MTITEPAQHGVRLQVSDEGIATVLLDRPAKKNALDGVMFAGLEAVLAELRERTDLKAVVLSGAGGSFSAGIDLGFLATSDGLSELTTRTHGPANLFQHVCWGWRDIPVPVIAAIEGVCFGGGIQIALGADFRIAAPTARMAVLEARWGLVPDMAGFPLLRGLVRADVMRELVYTGRQLSGEEAQQVGLVTRLADDPLDEAMALARQISTASSAALRAGKRLLGAALDDYADAPDLLMAESVAQQALLASPEFLTRINGG
ncbi:crotonase/enoyl-CoA hydratase family protein [Nocardioides daejeonensis]|uniref:crotonase/enoyl-CoA hydratase family protein n=1 Tax=Nocardioides daejeonensis TaxID=1046556 RepID=UPI000D746F96|nr:crotonase/enoyl-CoA hydratase family protein [Nocardioides daejeonensis]